MSDAEISGAVTQGDSSVGAESSTAGEGAPSVADNIAKHSVAKAQTAAPSAAGINQPTPTGTNAVEQAYQANLKFKFMGQEKDIPELFHGIMKTPEAEKMVRELHEQSMWFNETKPRFIDQTNQLTGITKGLDVLDQYLQSKNYDKFFDAFGLTDEHLFEYVKNKLEYQQLPPEQRQKLDADKEFRERSMQLEQENATLREQQIEYETQQRDEQLQSLLKHPQLSPVVEKHPGGASGFYRDVATHAWYHEQATGQDMTPEQAVLSYIQQRGLGAQAVQATQPTTMMPNPQQGVQQQRAPTIPSVPGQGTSPAKKVVSSMKDLRAAKLRAESQFGG